MGLADIHVFYGIDIPNSTTWNDYGKEETCPGCDGKGYQERKDNGLKVVCPICKGSGKWVRTWNWDYWIADRNTTSATYRWEYGN